MVCFITPYVVGFSFLVSRSLDNTICRLLLVELLHTAVLENAVSRGAIRQALRRFELNREATCHTHRYVKVRLFISFSISCLEQQSLGYFTTRGILITKNVHLPLPFAIGTQLTTVANNIIHNILLYNPSNQRDADEIENPSHPQRELNLGALYEIDLHASKTRKHRVGVPRITLVEFEELKLHPKCARDAQVIHIDREIKTSDGIDQLEQKLICIELQVQI
mmetsp:Transcript_78799/g.127785  ORF Transcript_78799/g.127785 Transcript_78799/m.127785 type:complete len:222 (-) Transcript_78799:3448-4113(-)